SQSCLNEVFRHALWRHNVIINFLISGLDPHPFGFTERLQMSFYVSPIAPAIVKDNKVIQAKPWLQHWPVHIYRQAKQQCKTHNAAPSPVKPSRKDREATRS